MPRLPTAIAAMMLLPLAGAAQEVEPEPPTLVTKSPFLPPDFAPPGTRTKPAAPPPGRGQYEFRGVYQLGDTFYFNVYNVREQKGKWVTPEGSDEIRVVAFDIQADELVVEVGGESMSLSLVETSDKPIPVKTASRPKVAPSSDQKRTTTTRRPVRRRVIRPLSRTASDRISAARRRVIRPTNRSKD